MQRASILPRSLGDPAVCLGALHQQAALGRFCFAPNHTQLCCRVCADGNTLFVSTAGLSQQVMFSLNDCVCNDMHTHQMLYAMCLASIDGAGTVCGLARAHGRVSHTPCTPHHPCVYTHTHARTRKWLPALPWRIRVGCRHSGTRVGCSCCAAFAGCGAYGA